MVDGRNEYEGRVEVCQEGQWGLVCDDNWLPDTSGLVVCKQVGINATGSYISTISYFHSTRRKRNFNNKLSCTCGAVYSPLLASFLKKKPSSFKVWDFTP